MSARWGKGRASGNPFPGEPKRTPPKRLKLNKETLRELSSKALRRAVGANGVEIIFTVLDTDIMSEMWMCPSDQCGSEQVS